MATELQYNYFRAVYEEENKRYEQLESRAKLFLSIETFYLGAIAFKLGDLTQFTKQFSIPMIVFVVAGASVVLGLLLTVRAISIRVYEAPSNLRDIIDAFGQKPPSDSDFCDDRLSDFVTATDRNSRVNDRVAGLLTAVGYLLSAAIVCHFVSFVWAYLSLMEKT